MCLLTEQFGCLLLAAVCFVVTAAWTQDPANFSANYTFSVSRLEPYLFVYNYTVTENKTTAVRVWASSGGADDEFPVMFVVRQQEGIISWQIPLVIQHRFKYSFVSRTLCPLTDLQGMAIASQLVNVDVTTMSDRNVSFDLLAQELESFELQQDLPLNISASPSEPQFFLYKFPADVDSVKLTVTSRSPSGDGPVNIVSVQRVMCPVFDLDANIEYEGRRQSMTTEATFFLQKREYAPSHAFFVVIFVKPVNSSHRPVSKPGLSDDKDLTITVTPAISSGQYSVAILSPLVFFLAFYVAVFTGSYLYRKSGCLKSPEDADCDPGNELSSSQATPRGSHDQLTRGCSNSLRERVEIAATESNTTHGDSHDTDVQIPTCRERCSWFFQAFLATDCRCVRNVLTIAIFYGVPVMQLVFKFQKSFLLTGDEDECYFNFACAHPVVSPRIVAFNNFFSNIGYILLGFLFVILVWRRDMSQRLLLEKYPGLQTNQRGVPQHFGLLYAMGAALVIEGVMSAGYHVCPSRINYQFDTSFMYIIACLCMMKIYGARHESVQPKVNHSYFFMAVIMLGVFIGLGWRESDIFWIVYALVHMLSTLVLTVMVYIDEKIGWCAVIGQIFSFRNWWQVIKKIPTFDNRVVLLVIGNVINWAIALYGAIVQPANVPSHVLYILIGNLGLYLIFYIIVKTYRRCRERQKSEGFNPMVVFVMVATLITWAAALFFFFQRLTSWQVSPARSRQRNRKCILLDFYDDHDVWHFLSAVAMFLSFVLILILDDGLALTPRTSIESL